MQSPSITLYAGLVPGITNVTLRVRYYAFYPWLCEQYARTLHDPSPLRWKRFVRRAEALLALSCHATATDEAAAWAGLGGIDWAVRTYDGESSSAIDFGAAAEPDAKAHYLAAEFGVFGQAYLGPLRDMGILTHTRNHSLPVLAPGLGEELAASFAASVGAAGARFIEILERGSATPVELRELGAAFRADHPRKGGAERDSLHRALFREDVMPATGLFRGAASRRESLLLFLHVASRERPDRDSVCWALYSGFAVDGLPLKIPDSLSAAAGMWQAYQANELSHLLVEAWLNLILTSLQEGRSIPLGEVLQRFAEALFQGGEPPESWRALRSSLTLADNPRDLQAPDSEARLAEEVRGASPAQAAVAALRLLAVLDRRWPGTSHSVGNTFSLTLGDLHHQSLMGVLRFFREREDQPLPATLLEFVRRFVIEQHLHVALTKLRYQGKRTFLFELVDGQLRGLSEISPDWTNPRIETSLSFLRDLALLQEPKASLGQTAGSVLTELGMQTLEAL